MRRAALTIENRSDWPTPALEVLIRWVCKREGLGTAGHPYRVLVRACTRNTWGGRGGSNFQRVWLDRHYRRISGRSKATLEGLNILRKSARKHLAGELRKNRLNGDARYTDRVDTLEDRIKSINEMIRFGDYADSRKPRVNGNPLWPFTHADPRFKWSKPETYRSRLELLVALIAHEAHHATLGHPDRYRTGNAVKKIDRASMEFRCNRAMGEAAAALHNEWPELRKAIYAAMRKARANKVTAQVRKTDPTPKLAKAQDALAEWQRKAKLAATKIRKYRLRVRYYEGKVAAKR